MTSTTLGAPAASRREQFQSLMRAVGMLPVLILKECVHQMLKFISRNNSKTMPMLKSKLFQI